MDRISLFFMRLICIAMWVASAVIFLRGAMRGDPFQFIFDFVFIALPLAIIAGVLSSRYFMNAIAERILDAIYCPRQFLKKAPLSLSVWYGDLARGHYAKIVQEMQALPPEEFLSPEVTLLFAQASMNLPGREEEGLNRMESVFRSSARQQDSESNLALLLYYADTAAAFRRPEEICRVLEAESRKRCYAEPAKKSIRTRINALKGTAGL